jgi:AraC-like DNA-binding protein
MKKLIRLCSSSESNFRKLFHKAVGCAPHTYIKKLRMKNVAVLLRNSKRTILDIAISSGYDTLSNFNRQFLGFYGVSPRGWRKKNCGLPRKTSEGESGSWPPVRISPKIFS